MSKTLTGILAIGLSAALTTDRAGAAPPPQRAAALSVTVDPNPVVIHGNRSTWVTVTASLGGAVVYDISATMRHTSGDGYEDATLTDPDKNGVWTGRTKFDAFAPAGKWRIETTIIPNDGSGIRPGPTGGFTVRGESKVSLSAKPATVRKGKAVKLTGILRVTKDGGYSLYSGKWVKLYWRAKTTGKWQYVTRAKTKSYYPYTATVKAKKSGYWQAVWDGTSHYLKATSKPVRVTVK